MKLVAKCSAFVSLTYQELVRDCNLIPLNENIVISSKCIT